MTRMEIPMNMKRNLRGVLAAALVLLLILALAGCGAKGGDAHPSSPAPAPSAPETPPAPTDGYTHVSTVEELVEAIRPQAKIMIEPRYAAVLNFSGCTGIELGCLTMGHTDTGDCSGDVLYFDNTKSIYLHSLDLYGCGVYGIGCNDFCGNMYVTNSTIRDCEYGPFEIFNGEGDFEFTACTLSGNGGGGVFEINEVSQLSFIACSFGQEESNYWYFDESASFDDCEFMEPDYEDFYGDYDEYVPAFDPEAMEEISSPYKNTDSDLWLLMQYDDDLIWFY